MRQPPSQRPERHGPHRYEVGKPYDPRRRSWPERADYNWRGEHELRIFLARASPAEVHSLQRGRVEFGLWTPLPELSLISRFHGPDDRVLLSSDRSYQWHLVPVPGRTAPPPWEETSPELRAVCQIVAVEATNGLILGLRAVSFSPEFTRALHRAIAAQIGLPFDPAAHGRAVAGITRRFTTEQLWQQCPVRCVGGA